MPCGHPRSRLARQAARSARSCVDRMYSHGQRPIYVHY
jgi:hypothetical protein